MYNRKGQAALEFMMTYGWAILVVLAAIGALSYFGILNPSRFTPDTCLASAPFSCPGKPLVTSDGNITLSLVNGQGYSILVNASTMTYSVTMTGCTPANTKVCTQGDLTCNGNNQTALPGQGITLRVTGCNFANSNVVKGDINIPYVNINSKLTEQILISVTGKPR